MFKIRKAQLEKDSVDIHRIIQLANSTVAEDLNLTSDNAPTSTAFIKIDKVKESFNNGVEYYIGHINRTAVGCVAYICMLIVIILLLKNTNVHKI